MSRRLKSGGGAARRRAGAHGPGATPRPVGCAVITVSDTRRGREDTAGASIERLIRGAGHLVTTRAWVKDEAAALRRAARAALGRADVDVVVVTGGTGLGPRDRTPEALRPLAERIVPGFGELFRVVSVSQVGPAAWLSRAEAFVARGRLVVLLPGSRAAVELAMSELLLPEIVHAARMLGRFESAEG